MASSSPLAERCGASQHESPGQAAELPAAPPARPAPIQTGAAPSEEVAAVVPAAPDGAASVSSAATTEPNPENKLFVGGCPPSSAEEELRKVFEPYGTVEEVFIMRGGSRSGMACAFVRYQTQQMAKLAIEAIHGQITLENASEPLVVRWADAPGSRKRTTNNHYGQRRGGGHGGGHRDMGRSGGHMSYMQQQQQQQQQQQGAYGYHQHMAMHHMASPMQMQAMNGQYPGVYQQYQQGANYGAGMPMGYMHQQHVQMLNYPQAAQMAQWQGQPMSPTGQLSPGQQQQMISQGQQMAQSTRVNQMMATAMHYQQYGQQYGQPAAGPRPAAEGMEAFAGSGQARGGGGGGKGSRASPRLGAGAGTLPAARGPTG